MCAWVLLYLECHDRCACGWMDTNGMIPSPAAPYRFIPRRCAACMGDLLAAATTTTFDFCSIGRECDWIASNFGRCVDASNVWVSCVFSFIHIHNVYVYTYKRLSNGVYYAIVLQHLARVFGKARQILLL